MSHSLAGSSMLSALGVGAGPATAVGFSAAIKWVTKDGVGALGRLFVGGRLSSVFDEDPKKWRMVAEAVTTLGLALEIATQVSPSNFVLLAGSGTLAKATGKGMGRPCFRVIQTHFATRGAQLNVGDVAAKEEIWEVAAQLLGLSASVALLSVLEASGTPEAVIPCWAAIHAVHVWVRYTALTKLRFPYPNYQRGCVLVGGYIASAGHAVVTIDDANSQETLLFSLNPTTSTTGSSIPVPRCQFGCSIDQVVGCVGAPPLPDLIALYKDEKYILTYDAQDETAYVAMWEDAGPVDMLRALFQSAVGGPVAVAGEGEGNGRRERESLIEMQSKFGDFESKATAAGWQLHRTVFPSGSFRLARS